MVTVLAALMGACGAPSSKNGSGAAGGGPAAAAPVDEILARGAEHSTEAIEALAAKIETGAELDDADVAEMVVNVEASASHLGQIIDAVEANDDDADAFNVLSELGTARWVKSFTTVERFLAGSDFPEVFAPRIAGIEKTVERLNNQIAAIGAARFGGRRFVAL